jgi:uncharacterized protein YjbJ (UPF0337 family)
MMESRLLFMKIKKLGSVSCGHLFNLYGIFIRQRVSPHSFLSVGLSFEGGTCRRPLHVSKPEKEDSMDNFQAPQQDPAKKNPGEAFNKNEKETFMNQDQAKDKFDQFKGKIKETWGRLTDDDIALYNGKREQFFAKLAEKYDIMKEDAEKKLRQMEQTAKYDTDKAA